MKKYLLTSLLGLFGLVGAFASATNYSFTATNNTLGYSPNTITFDSDISVPSDLSDFITSYSCDYCVGQDECGIYCDFQIYGNDIDGLIECPGTTDGVIDFSSCSNSMPSVIPAGTYSVDRASETAFNSIIITDGQNEGGDSSGSLLPGGEGSLSGIITGLSTTLNEFIPYLVYVGLGVLGAVIGFFAIKWLMNRIRAKVLGTFSGGRRR